MLVPVDKNQQELELSHDEAEKLIHSLVQREREKASQKSLSLSEGDLSNASSSDSATNPKSDPLPVMSSSFIGFDCRD